METQMMIFANSLNNSTPASHFYASYHTPPHTSNYCPSPLPGAVYQPFSMSEDVLQTQQQLRFPTPPNTPPRSFNNSTADFAYAQSSPESANHTTIKAFQQRTQSVIMKIGHDRNPQYLTPDLHYDHFGRGSKNAQAQFNGQDHNQLQSHTETHSSGTSSPTSQNEFICDWIGCGR